MAARSKMSIDLAGPASSPQQALDWVGISVWGKAPTITAPMATRWSGTFGNVTYTDLAALKMNGTGYDTVRVRIE